jgi:hypothetical protein
MRDLGGTLLEGLIDGRANLLTRDEVDEDRGKGNGQRNRCGRRNGDARTEAHVPVSGA